ncbi:uncharacterized protein LODBEIA_P29510 [Lodderomyces beijingensis]|uniref:Uncharacterized protein n=1 Tax=Lodderomyces beijingensis TaxID=1775926 RepID=A0ABP0ZKP9_9ASCO
MVDEAKIEEARIKLAQHSLTEEQDGEEVAFLDVYMRFNDDMEKDYCFQVTTKTRFKDLYKVFHTLPISLRPSVFYYSRPIGFRKSTAPGFLTEDGNFIFDNDAGKIKSAIIPSDELVNDHLWPGQLILPEWQFNDFAFFSTVALLVTWLYTDLPDFISPTPGICLTNQCTKLMAKAAAHFGFDSVAASLLKDIEGDVSIPLQCIFFGFHLIKAFFLFGFLYTGAFNPIKVFRFNGFGQSGVKLEVTREELVKLGWTGTRKATIDEYKDFYREYKIQEHGGMIAAHQAGLFNTIRHLGVQLHEGEGYNTPLSTDNKTAKMKELEIKAKTDPQFKFKLNYEWFAELGYVFAATSADKEGSDLAALIKQFRRYGLLVSDKRIQTVVQAKKKQAYADLLEDEQLSTSPAATAAPKEAKAAKIEEAVEEEAEVKE